MRIGVVVDGDSEYRSFANVCEKIRPDCGHAFLRPVKATVDPMAPAPAIARMVKDRVLAAEARGASLVVVLLDRETRDECPGELATAIRENIENYATARICVVIKNRKFENWLVADIRSLAAMRARFNITAGRRRLVEGDRADSIDGHGLLRQAAKGDAYDKVLDSRRILERADPVAIAANSRSFRKFLRCVGHPKYVAQSRLPV